MQRVMITIPPALLAQVDEMAAKLNLSRGGLIVTCFSNFLTRNVARIRELLKEGYLIYAERDLRISEEFAAADYEATMTMSAL